MTPLASPLSLYTSLKFPWHFPRDDAIPREPRRALDALSSIVNPQKGQDAMSLRRMLRLVGVAGGFGLMAATAAQQPDSPPPLKPITSIPLAVDIPGQIAPPAITKVELSTAPVNGADAFPKMLAEARAAHAKLRDYSCHLVRTERVRGKLQAEQTTELRVRVQPMCVSVRVVAPKSVAGQETSYIASKSTSKVRFKAAGVEGVRGFVTLDKDDAKVLADTRHTLPETGLLAVAERIEKVVATEKKLNNAVQILVSEYTFAGRPVTRYEVFADRVHPNRYAHRCVLYIDKETKLPARFEAYETPKPGTTEGELIEVQSFVGLRTNTGLGEAAFDR